MISRNTNGNGTPYEALDQFVKSWEKGNADNLEFCVVKEPFLYMGIFGNVYDLEAMKELLRLPENRPEKCSIKIINEATVYDGCRARQYASVLGYFEEEGSHIAFGGSFVNTLIQSDEGWLIETMRFEMKSDDAFKRIWLTETGKIEHEKGSGDLSLLKGWKLVNDRVGCFMGAVEGQANEVICAEYDAPWFAPSQTGLHKTEEEQIKELFARLCFAYDYSCMLLIRQIMTPQSIIRTKDGTFELRDAIGYLKLKRQAAPRSFHAGRVESIVMDGERALATITALAPENFKRANDGRPVFDGEIIQMQAVKIDSKWMLEKLEVGSFAD